MGRGRRSWVWVNVVGEKKFSKKKYNKNEIRFMKRKSPRTYQSSSPSPRSAKQISESFISTNGQ